MIRSEETVPIPRTTLTQMVVEFRQAARDIEESFARLSEAEARLKETFGDTGSSFDLSYQLRYQHADFNDPKKVQDHLRLGVWKALINKMELRRILSVKKAEELDKQLQTGEGFPEITEENILGMLRGTLAQAETFIEEAVREVYDRVRPWRDREAAHKTNEKNRWRLGGKIIMEGHLSYGGTQVCHYRQKYVTAMDNVFHSLDGRPPVLSHYGPLYDAIYAAKGEAGETDYFCFKCFRNGNLHVEFKRLDLVEKFNAVAGGMRLKAPTQ